LYPLSASSRTAGALIPRDVRPPSRGLRGERPETCEKSRARVGRLRLFERTASERRLEADREDRRRGRPSHARSARTCARPSSAFSRTGDGRDVPASPHVTDPRRHPDRFGPHHLPNWAGKAPRSPRRMRASAEPSREMPSRERGPNRARPEAAATRMGCARHGPKIDHTRKRDRDRAPNVRASGPPRGRREASPCPRSLGRGG